MTRVILTRHCEAEGNVKQIFQGYTDAPVTENGHRQLELPALRLRNTEIDVLYSSPPVRAYEAVVAINQYHNLPILQEQGLMELNGGGWEGIPWMDLPEKFPEMAGIWWTAPCEFVPEQGESMRQIYDRIWDIVMRLVQEDPGKTIAATNHGYAIRNFLRRVTGWLIEQFSDMDWSSSTAVSIVDFDEEQNAIIRLRNDAPHLTEELTCAAPRNWTRKN